MKIILLLTFISSFSFAKKPTHREHSAHVHGSATLSIAFDKNKGKIEFKSPSDSIIGFEHEAKSATDIKQKQEALLLFKDKISEMITFNQSLKCLFNQSKVDVIKESGEHSGQHSDIAASFEVTCSKPLAGSQIIFNFQKYFPKLKDIDVQLLADEIQMSFEVQKIGTTLDIK